MPGEDACAFVLEGDVVTMDVARPYAEAVAVREGRIVAVGASADVRAAIGGDPPVVALGDASVLPGFIDVLLWLRAAHGRRLWQSLYGAV